MTILIRQISGRRSGFLRLKNSNRVIRRSFFGKPTLSGETHCSKWCGLLKTGGDHGAEIIILIGYGAMCTV